jgi:hypothetical protein
VLACDWATALSELGPPASKRGTHNLPALSPAAALPAPLLPLLLPALTQVVTALHDWLWLGPLEQQQWQQLAGLGAVVGDGAGAGVGARHGDRKGGGSGQVSDFTSSLAAAGGVERQAGGSGFDPVAELLVSWGVVQDGDCINGNIISSSSGQEGGTAAAAGGGTQPGGAAGAGVAEGDMQQGLGLSTVPPLAAAAATGGLCGGSSGSCSIRSSGLMGAAAVVQQQQQLGGSSRPVCLLLSGCGSQGQAELTAATLKLLDSSAGETHTD